MSKLCALCIVADDPFGETDCSTYGIDIDLLYFCILQISKLCKHCISSSSVNYKLVRLKKYMSVSNVLKYVLCFFFLDKNDKMC